MTRRDAAAVIFRSPASPEWETALAFVDLVNEELVPDAEPIDRYVIAEPVEVMSETKARARSFMLGRSTE